MLPASRRLRAAEVRQVIKEGRSLSSAALAVKWTAGAKGKAAVVVSKKTAKTAVVRNKLRRAIYGEIPTLPRVHAVFFVRKVVPLEDIKKETHTLCSKLT